MQAYDVYLSRNALPLREENWTSDNSAGPRFSDNERINIFKWTIPLSYQIESFGVMCA